jgi:hypothetical protein
LINGKQPSVTAS